MTRKGIYGEGKERRRVEKKGNNDMRGKGRNKDCSGMQLKGFGMGKSTSSPLSDIFVEDFEEAVLANYPPGDNTTSPSQPILFWFRKADDTLTAVHNQHSKIISTPYTQTSNGPKS